MALRKREIVRSLKELSRALNVSLSSVVRWRKLGMPGERNHYDVVACRIWFQSQGSALVETDGKSRSWAEEIKRHKAELLRLKVETETGRLIEKDAVEKALAGRAAVLRADFENWAHECAVALSDEFGVESQRIPDLQLWMIERGEAWFERYRAGAPVEGS